MRRYATAVVTAALLGIGTTAWAQEKVIFDTDFNTMGDDGQAFVMLAQAMKEGKIDLLGVTVVSGNQWLMQGVADAERAVERMGLAGEVEVYAGANYPLLHDAAMLEAEQALYGKGYSGAWRKPEPKSREELTAPPDGFASEVKVSDENAVGWLIDTIRANPDEVTILAVGPLTNIALAMRIDPGIVPLIKRIIYMGGAVEVPGNVTPAAEFNWWFDPEAAKIVVRAPVEHVVVPLDVTDTAAFDKSVFDAITASDTPVARMFEATYGKRFADDPEATAYVWDTIAAAYLLDESIVTDSIDVHLDVNAQFGPDYGRSLGHARNPPIGTQPATVIRRVDLDRFWAMYSDLLGRPIE
ncbi:MAG: nucleoside hydrolase [Geminicoccaceae bacterium]